MSVPGINSKRLFSDIDGDQNGMTDSKTIYSHCALQHSTEYINPQRLVQDFRAFEKAEEQHLKDAIHQLALCTMELQSAFLRYISKHDTKD